MASAGAFPRSNHIYVQHRVSTSSNSSHRALTASSSVIIPFYAEWKSAHLQIINYQKRQEQHHRRMLLPLNSRPCFCMWAAANVALESTECTFSYENTAEDNHHRCELGPFPEHVSILEGLGLVNKEIKLLILKHPFLLNLTPASMCKTIQVLQALGIKGDQLILLIRKRPSVFSVDLESTLEFIRENLEEFNVEKLQRVLFRADPRLVLSFPEKIKLLLHHGFQKSQLVNLLNKLNLNVLCERPVEDLNDVLLFLKDFDEEKGYCRLILRHPALLLLNVGRDLKPRIGFLEDLLEDEDSLKKLLRRFPGILAYTVEHMENHVAYLKSAVFTEDNIAIIVKVYPQILSLSIERTLQPRIEYLENCSLSKKEIAKLLIRYPTFLGLSFDENLSKKSTFLQKIGFQPYTYELAQALTTVTRINYEKLQATIGLLLSYGLSYVDICLMGSKQPHILRFSSKCLKPKIDYLVNDMYGSSKNLVSFPAFLGYSLEDRIKPRHKIMKQLISRGLVKQEYSLNRLLTISDKVFMEMAIEKGYRTDFNQ
eukprot:Gb_13847 [translate_table: standard]